MRNETKEEQMVGEKKKVKLDLVGLDGNAFSLLGAFKRAARKQGWNDVSIKDVIDEAMTSDYNHLLQTLLANTESE
jgi:hypothetical protein